MATVCHPVVGFAFCPFFPCTSLFITSLLFPRLLQSTVLFSICKPIKHYILPRSVDSSFPSLALSPFLSSDDSLPLRSKSLCNNHLSPSGSLPLSYLFLTPIYQSTFSLSPNLPRSTFPSAGAFLLTEGKSSC